MAGATHSCSSAFRASVSTSLRSSVTLRPAAFCNAGTSGPQEYPFLNFRYLQNSRLIVLSPQGAYKGSKNEIKLRIEQAVFVCLDFFYFIFSCTRPMCVHGECLWRYMLVHASEPFGERLDEAGNVRWVRPVLDFVGVQERVPLHELLPQFLRAKCAYANVHMNT